MNALPALLLFLPVTAYGLDQLLSVASPAPIEKLQQSGRVVAWHVAANGTVSLRVENPDLQPPTNLWFTSPADKNDSTRFEELMLNSVLAMSASKERLVVVYEQDKELAGKTIVDAHPIVALMWGTSLAELTPKK